MNKYDHLQVMGTIFQKFHQNPLKTVGGVAETRLCLRTDGQTNEPITIDPTKMLEIYKAFQSLQNEDVLVKCLEVRLNCLQNRDR